MKLLSRILQFPETLGKNLDKILTKSAKNMYDLARSCQELQEKCLIYSTEKKAEKVFLVQKPSRKNQASCQEIQENPRNAKNLAKKSGKMQEMPIILPKVSREKLTKVNENKQKPTPSSA